MDYPRQIPGTLTLHTTTPDKTNFNISLDIPQQVVMLQSIRVEFDSAASALAARLLYIDLPWLSANQLLDQNSGYVYLPIFVDNAVVTLRTNMQIPVVLNHHIPSSFTMVVRGSDLAPVDPAVCVSVSLQWELQSGHIS